MDIKMNPRAQQTFQLRTRYFNISEHEDTRYMQISPEDKLEISSEGAAWAAQIREAAPEPTIPVLKVDLGYASVPEEGLKPVAEPNAGPAAREFGVLRKEDGSLDHRETTFFWLGDVDDDYLQARGITSNGMYFSDLEIITCQLIRDQISQSVRDLLQKNNVTIPEGQSFTLSVDYNNFIHAVGLDDPELTEAVERAINVGNNGCRLKQHISDCRRVSQELGLTIPSAAESLSKSKESLFLMVQDLAGYDIRELDRQDGKIYTPDGQDLWDVLTKNAANYKTPDGIISIDISQYWMLYSHIALFGWDSVPDPVYELTYLDGNLYDIGTEYGYGPGQTEWQKWAHENAETLSNYAFRQIDKLMETTKAREASRKQRI